jgi:hypothetical protein
MMNNMQKRAILKYATIIALGDKATEDQKKELTSIEDMLHLPKESILKRATEFGLEQIN